VSKLYLAFALVLLATLSPAAAAQDVHDHVSLGITAMQAHDPPTGLAHFQAALALDSTSYEANWRAAIALLDEGEMTPDSVKSAHRDSLYARAESLARRAVAVDSTRAEGHFALAAAIGRASLTMGKKARIRRAAEIRAEALRTIAIDPRHDGAYHILGRWNAEIMRLPGLTKFFAKTFLGAGIFNRASWDSAMMYFGQAIHINPTNIYHHLDLAEALVDADRPEEAKPHLEEVARLPLGCDAGDPVFKEEAAALLVKISRR
jgi:tetratricopeptide (TPR) repeat protein